MISLFNLVLMASCLALTQGMRCYVGEESLVKDLVQSCPRPILDGSDKAYCCINTEGEFFCCDLFEFAFIYIMIAIVVAAILGLICSVLCCCWCPCCFFYKRRHAGNPI